MTVLSAGQIKAWDEYTIRHEPIASADLMERAARQCTRWLLQHVPDQPVSIFCGRGNNGGDGLAIARQLQAQGRTVTVYLAGGGKEGSPDFKTNLGRLESLPVPIRYITDTAGFPELKPGQWIVDALFGIGLRGPLTGPDAALVQHLNGSGAAIVSIDLPSGLLPDAPSSGHPVIIARHTLTFQCWKRALLVAENAPFFGQVQVLDIGLHPGFLKETTPPFQLMDQEVAQLLFRPRQNFAHKGTYGHALIMGGSYGKMGAAVLAVSACVRTGAGLVTAYVPACGYTILQTTVPEAMTVTDGADKFIIQPPSELGRCNALSMGPGLGTEEDTLRVVSFIVRRFKKALVVDADGLNCLSMQPDLLSQLCRNTLLTPHPKEFDRLFGNCSDEFARQDKAMEKARELQVIIILKGHHTLIALPDGRAFFNTSGNAGMAKGGSGDVLTGMLASLLAQGYPPAEAAQLGVFLHGRAGDCAARKLSQEAMTASNLIAHLPDVFLELNGGAC